MLEVLASLVPPNVPDTVAESHYAGEWLVRDLAGVLLPIVVLTVLHIALRLMDRAGWIRYDGARLVSALSGAAVAINALFQPHARDPLVGKVQKLHVDRQSEPAAPAGPDLPDESEFPDDGLRGGLSRDSKVLGKIN